MSKRVPFLRGNTINEDHTHWRTADISRKSTDSIICPNIGGFPVSLTNADPYYPLGLTLDEMMLLTWRARTLTASGSFTAVLNFVHGARLSNLNSTIDANFESHRVRVADINNPITHTDWVSFGYKPDYQSIDVGDEEWQIMGPPNPQLNQRHPPHGTAVTPTDYTSDDVLYPDQISLTGNPPTIGFGNFGFLTDDGSSWRYSPVYPPDSTFPTPSIPTTSTVDNSVTFRDTGTTTSTLAFLMDFWISAYQPDGTGGPLPPQGQVYYDPGTQLFYPFMMIVFVASATVDAPGASGNYAIVGTTVDQTGSDPTMGVVTVFGHNLTIYKNQDVKAGAITSVDTPNAALVIDVESFWPYTNSTGSPVYDTATGAVLNDPFS
jgi:hypothetical protein